MAVVIAGHQQAPFNQPESLKIQFLPGRPISSSQNTSPITLRKNKKPEPRSQSAPPSRNTGTKATHNAPRKRKTGSGIAWDIDITPDLWSRVVPKTIHGDDLKIAGKTLLGGTEGLLESLIAEAFIKTQRQSKSLKLFLRASDIQAGLWNRLKWYSNKGLVFSVINIMREWVKMPKSGTLWCRKHDINVTFLKYLWDQCKSLHAALCTANKKQIPEAVKFEKLTFGKDPDATEEKLWRNMLDVYGQNLCIYSGNQVAGYYCISRRTRFQVNFISGVNQFGEIPQYLVPLTLPKSKTIKCFLPLCDMAADTVASALNISLKDISSEVRLQMLEKHNIGAETQQRLMNFLLNDKAIKAICDDLYFEPDSEMRKLKVYFSRNIEAEVRSSIEIGLSEIKATIQGESLVLSKGIKLKIKDGKCEQKLALSMLPGYRCQKIENYQDEGCVLHITSPHQSDPCKSSSVLQDLHAKLLKRFANTTIRPVFKGNKIAELLVTCFTKDEAKEIRDLCEMQSCFVHIRKDIFALPTLKNHTRQPDILVQRKDITGVVLIKVPKCKLNQDVRDAVEKMLMESFGENYCNKVTCDLKTITDGTDKNEKTAVRFKFTSKDAPESIKKIASKSVFERGITFQNKDEVNKNLCSLTVTAGPTVYDALGNEIIKEIGRIDQCNIASKSIDRDGSVELNILCSNANDARMLQHTLESLANPILVPVYDENTRKFLLSTQGVLFLNHIKARTSASAAIRYSQNNTMSVKLLGSAYARNRAWEILEKLDITSKWVAHSIKGNEGNLMQTIIPFVEPKTRKISSIPGVMQAVLDSGNNQVICQLSQEEAKTALEILDWEEVTDITSDSPRKSCASCFKEININVERNYMLEVCNHYYCSDCITQQINVSLRENKLPLQCAECSEMFSFQDLLNLSHRMKDVLFQNDIIASAIRHCIMVNPKQYMHCPYYSCGALLMLNDQETDEEFKCSYCSNSVCLRCRHVSHRGMSCDEFTKDVKEWIGVDPRNRRRCPSCNMGIEKTGGCSNVGCTHCKKAICWKCEHFFETEDLCYRHLRAVHGGYH